MLFSGTDGGFDEKCRGQPKSDCRLPLKSASHTAVAAARRYFLTAWRAKHSEKNAVTATRAY
jgi:hypothetical protein